MASSQIFNFPKKSGVYQLINKRNNRIYIGSAVDMYTRAHKHIHDLKNNKHKNQYLQNDWNKNYESDFYIGILEYAKADKLCCVEQKYIDVLFDKQNFCYNICEKANSWLGKKHTKKSKEKMSKAHIGKRLSIETKKKMSKAHIGKKHTNEWKKLASKRFSGRNNPNFGNYESESKSSKTVYQFDLEGNLIGIFQSIAEASKKTKTCKTSISSCCHFKLKKAGGYKWALNKELGD